MTATTPRFVTRLRQCKAIVEEGNPELPRNRKRVAQALDEAMLFVFYAERLALDIEAHAASQLPLAKAQELLRRVRQR